MPAPNIGGDQQQSYSSLRQAVDRILGFEPGGQSTQGPQGAGGTPGFGTGQAPMWSEFMLGQKPPISDISNVSNFATVTAPPVAPPPTTVTAPAPPPPAPVAAPPPPPAAAPIPAPAPAPPAAPVYTPSYDTSRYHNPYQPGSSMWQTQEDFLNKNYPKK